jgi:hypothetical protein
MEEYFEDQPGRRSAAKLLSKDKGTGYANRTRDEGFPPPWHGPSIIRPARDDDVLPAFRRRCLFASD